MEENLFETTIKAYLDARAAEDETFAAAYAKEGKSLGKCCNYIISEVRTSGRQGFADEEIFGMAVHYYIEDDIEDAEPHRCNVVINRSIAQPAEGTVKKTKPKAVKGDKGAPRAKRKAPGEHQSKAERARFRREAIAKMESSQLLLFDM
ncbi:MAG: PcfK-like family protein [Bacteroidaceae bacterium]|nr:PcfK-like family protein [Bacteroidaceae bacterium]